MENKYAFLMIDYETPELIKELQDSISSNEIYDNDKHEYGIEKESHVTLVPCLDNDTDCEDLKKYLLPLSKYEIVLTNISYFKNDDYDVLKCDANSDFLDKTNKEIAKDFKLHTEFKDYHPHMTIAYLKHGIVDKYTKDCLDKLIVLKPKSFRFSFYDENGEQKNILFK